MKLTIAQQKLLFRLLSGAQLTRPVINGIPCGGFRSAHPFELVWSPEKLGTVRPLERAGLIRRTFRGESHEQWCWELTEAGLVEG